MMALICALPEARPPLKLGQNSHRNRVPGRVGRGGRGRREEGRRGGVVDIMEWNIYLRHISIRHDETKMRMLFSGHIHQVLLKATT